MKWVDTITNLMNRFAYGILFAMMMLTVTDVVLRKLFSKGILGTLEMTEFMMVGLVLFALGRVERLDRNISVDLVMKHMSRRVRLMVEMITRLICFIFFSLVTASLLVYAQAMKASHEATVDLWIPSYPFVYAAAAGCAVLALVLLMKCLTDIMEFKKSWNP
jgi:TRAP-type C4-dicarboxylate transport system permease small subunit